MLLLLAEVRWATIMCSLSADCVRWKWHKLGSGICSLYSSVCLARVL